MTPKELRAEIAELKETMKTPGFPAAEEPKFKAIIADLEKKLEKAEQKEADKPKAWKDRPVVEFTDEVTELFRSKHGKPIKQFATKTDIAEAHESGLTPEKFVSDLIKSLEIKEPEKKAKAKGGPDMKLDDCAEILKSQQKQEKAKEKTSAKISEAVTKAKRRQPIVSFRDDTVDSLQRLATNLSRQKQHAGQEKELSYLIRKYEPLYKAIAELIKADVEDMEEVD